MVSDGVTNEAVMSGHGFYNRHSVLQANAAESGLATLTAAAGLAPVAAHGPSTIADYGCSQGQNSLRPMAAAVAGLHSAGARAVTVVHTDLPDNDFSSLFEVLAHDPTSYLADDPDAFALAAGRSFYEPVLPPATVSLGWSSVTTHWLSRLPVPVPGHVSAQAGAPPDLQDRFRQQAAEDWAAFLDARAHELRPGARLVMVEPCAHPDGWMGSEAMMGLLDQVVGELVGEGRVSAEAATAATLPVWMRTPDEYGEPVRAHPQLELCGLDVLEGVRSPLWTAFARDGDAEAYADAAVGSMRAWSGAILEESFGDAGLIDELFARCRRLGIEDPERLHVHTFHVVMDIGRR